MMKVRRMMYALGPVTVEPGEHASMKVECSSMFRGERVMIPTECQGAFVITHLRTDGRENLIGSISADVFATSGEQESTSIDLDTAKQITLDVQSVAEHRTTWRAALARLAVLIHIDSRYWRNGWSFGLGLWWWVWPPRMVAKFLRGMGVRKRVFGTQRFSACIVGMEATDEPVSPYLYSESDPDLDICPICEKDFEECDCDEDTCPNCGLDKDVECMCDDEFEGDPKPIEKRKP